MVAPFDPVHLGHLNAASAVKQYLGLDEVRLVLNAQPAHKQAECVSAEHRWAMLNSACANRAGWLLTIRNCCEAADPIPSTRCEPCSSKIQTPFYVGSSAKILCNTAFLASLASYVGLLQLCCT
ncbi:MAG: hypothetical protein CM15mP120_24980 [Pseudomonadota bacterium]|nr:MAG: hypothetical protein CM15mP120_24980 [Pseudomonadota bacterium]